jgi:hypothetical protein
VRVEVEGVEVGGIIRCSSRTRRRSRVAVVMVAVPGGNTKIDPFTSLSGINILWT